MEGHTHINQTYISTSDFRICTHSSVVLGGWKGGIFCSGEYMDESKSVCVSTCVIELSGSESEESSPTTNSTLSTFSDVKSIMHNKDYVYTDLLSVKFPPPPKKVSVY